MKMSAPVLFLFFSLPAFASPADFSAVDAACRTPAAIDGEVFYCSENTQAVAKARQCRDALKRMWDNAPADLHPKFEDLFANNDGKQQVNFHDTGTDYDTAENKLAHLIGKTQDKTDFVAEYPNVMVDYPGAAVDPSLSAPCYNDQVDEIQKIVAEMDDMILQGKSTLAESERLHGISHVRDGGVDTAGSKAVIHGGVAEGSASVRIPAGDSFNMPSDISGTKEAKVRDRPEEEILDNFPLRDQLINP